MKIVFATHNPGKLVEMKKMLPSFEVLSASEAGVSEDVEEDGETFAANALKKARFVASKTGEWAVADDSGLCIDALGGEPGVYTARWALGRDLVEYTLERTKDVPEKKRGARFESAVAIVSPAGSEKVFTGVVRGELALAPRGQALPKLPYDVIFIPEGYKKTFAEMNEDEKNSLSHRGQAFRLMRAYLENALPENIG
ncbi:MAG: RdgB/HAM1 family non-canonical purine NTP pyrophosphatase [Candidatus Falkowbacteria bacterium]